MNHSSVLALVEREKPELVAVFGTTLLRPPLLSNAHRAVINLHPGLAPHYRGVDCQFWALLRGEPQSVGCTLHFVDAGIDTGDVLVQVRPEVTPGDDDRTLLWKTIREGVETYAELMARLERGERLGRPQAAKGRLYRACERTPAHERELKSKLAAGLLAGLSLPVRVTWFPAKGERAELFVSS